MHPPPTGQILKAELRSEHQVTKFEAQKPFASDGTLVGPLMKQMPRGDRATLIQITYTRSRGDLISSCACRLQSLLLSKGLDNMSRDCTTTDGLALKQQTLKPSRIIHTGGPCKGRNNPRLFFLFGNSRALHHSERYRRIWNESRTDSVAMLPNIREAMAISGYWVRRVCCVLSNSRFMGVDSTGMEKYLFMSEDAS